MQFGLSRTKNIKIKYSQNSARAVKQKENLRSCFYNAKSKQHEGYINARFYFQKLIFIMAYWKY